MRLLKNFDLFKEYYNLDTKQFCTFESLQKTVGIYKTFGDMIIGLLVENNNLYFLYGKEKFLITESYRVILKGKSKVKNEFSLINGNVVIAKFLYPIPSTKLNISPFEYLDEDDFKWGEFIANIINSEERKKNFVLNLMESR